MKHSIFIIIIILNSRNCKETKKISSYYSFFIFSYLICLIKLNFQMTCRQNFSIIFLSFSEYICFIFFGWKHMGVENLWHGDLFCHILYSSRVIEIKSDKVSHQVKNWKFINIQLFLNMFKKRREVKVVLIFFVHFCCLQWNLYFHTNFFVLYSIRLKLTYMNVIENKKKSNTFEWELKILLNDYY
jgi:hypothetical protein